jgi:hypothetical protein
MLACLDLDSHGQGTLMRLGMRNNANRATTNSIG